MSKAVLISIRPKWCEMIASGKKTVEVRKNHPKLETPFKCYIYCTKPSKRHQTICGHMVLNDDELFRHPRKGIKYGDSIELMCEDDYSADNFLNGKVIGEFICDDIFKICLTDEGYDFDTPKMTGLKYEEMEAYLERKDGFGWHISDLVIYDKPKKLGEFKRHDPTYDFSIFGEVSRTYSINRPPQSWCYVEQEG